MQERQLRFNSAPSAIGEIADTDRCASPICSSVSLPRARLCSCCKSDVIRAAHYSPGSTGKKSICSVSEKKRRKLALSDVKKILIHPRKDVALKFFTFLRECTFFSQALIDLLRNKCKKGFTKSRECLVISLFEKSFIHYYNTENHTLYFQSHLTLNVLYMIDSLPSTFFLRNARTPRCISVRQQRDVTQVETLLSFPIL